MDFVKMEGLGNDFIVVDGPVDLSPRTIVAWCDRRFGVGADGILEISRLPEDRIGMRYWNADGGEAEMCGNGLRCLVNLAVERGWVPGPDVTVETAVGELPATVYGGGLVRALVGQPRRVGAPFHVLGIDVHPIRVGNPHGVVFVEDVDSVPVSDLGPAIEVHDSFSNRANVEFVRVVDPENLEMRVWERGVGETLASGTGATAAAYAAKAYRGGGDTVEVHLRGGVLRIELSKDDAWMIGPGRTVFSGTLPEEP